VCKLERERRIEESLLQPLLTFSTATRQQDVERSMIMYARVTHYLILPGKLEEFIRLIQEESIAPAKQQAGFRDSYILTHRRLGVCVVITLWETEADLLASEKGSILQEQLIKVVSVLATLPNRELYEVSPEHQSAP
jgi:hypothetical protein